MSYENAQLFVEEMKTDSRFRSLVANVENGESLMALLREKSYDFDQKDLVRAMAACMAEIDEMMDR